MNARGQARATSPRRAPRRVESRDYAERRASRLSQEVEVAAVLGLEHVIHVELGVAPRGGRRGPRERRAPPRERGLVDGELQPALVDAQANAVTVLDERERAADGRLGRDV